MADLFRSELFRFDLVGIDLLGSDLVRALRLFDHVPKFDERVAIAQSDAPTSLASEVWRLISLQDYNTRVVLLGTIIIGVSAGLLGVFLLLRRRALIGDAIAHATLPGVAIAYMATSVMGADKSLPVLLLGGFLSGSLGGATVLALRHLVKIREDAALGIVLSVFFGAGVALVSVAQNLPGGNAAGLEGFIYGKAASMTFEDVAMSGAVGVAIVFILAAVNKELKILCFDAELAASQGWPVLLLDSILIGLVVAVTMVGLRAVGLILMIALLVIPAASARFWTHQLERMLLISAGLGGISCALGTLISASVDRMPSGATIVLASCVGFLVSFLFGSKRGVWWRFVRYWKMRRDHDFQHLLRSAYEVLEAKDLLPDSGRQLRSTEPVSLRELSQQRRWELSRVKSLAQRMSQADLLVLESDDSIRLTPRGILRALATVRDHRLLEKYLVEEANAKIVAADREADYLEHGLEPEHLAELTGELSTDQRPILPNPHDVKLENEE